MEANATNPRVSCVEAICYFEQSAPPFIHWAIRGEPNSLRALARLVMVAQPEPEPEPEPVPVDCSEQDAKLSEIATICNSGVRAAAKVKQIQTVLAG